MTLDTMNQLDMTLKSQLLTAIFKISMGSDPTVVDQAQVRPWSCIALRPPLRHTATQLGQARATCGPECPWQWASSECVAGVLVEPCLKVRPVIVNT